MESNFLKPESPCSAYINPSGDLDENSAGDESLLGLTGRRFSAASTRRSSSQVINIDNDGVSHNGSFRKADGVASPRFNNPIINRSILSDKSFNGSTTSNTTTSKGWMNFFRNRKPNHNHSKKNISNSSVLSDANNNNVENSNKYTRFFPDELYDDDYQDNFNSRYGNGRIMFYSDSSGVVKSDEIHGILDQTSIHVTEYHENENENDNNNNDTNNTNNTNNNNNEEEEEEEEEEEDSLNLLSQKLTQSNVSWLDVTNPTDEEMILLSKLFDIHPLTSEDIMTEETREKCEDFVNYYFICIRTFDHDQYSVSYMQPINVYLVIFKNLVLSFHCREISHMDNVLNRIDQLKTYGMVVTPDWINYAVIDDVTDSFMPMMRFIELEVDSIDDLVLILKESEQSDMLRRIGHARKQVMQMLRLLSSKAEVLRTIMKRSNAPNNLHNQPLYSQGGKMDDNSDKNIYQPANIESETSLYLGDIQDHVISMVQNLTHYEKTLSRAHSNYLAQISIEITKASNNTNDVVMKMTALASILLPLNVITGLFGMNVKVPGDGVENYRWFAGIVSVMILFAITVVVIAKKHKLV